MAKYAKGKYAYGIDDLSGFKVPYRRLRKMWNGRKTTSPDFDYRHPQDFPPARSKLTDAILLEDPRPDFDDPGMHLRVQQVAVLEPLSTDPDFSLT